MIRIAFLGLGKMGTLMARHLLEAGHDLVVWNRTPSRTEPLVAAGAKAAGTPAEAVTGRELVITMLAGQDAVREVFFGPDGAAGVLSPGALVAEMSTIGPEAVGELRAALPAEVRLVDAPVLGSLPQAEAGELRIFLGGSEADTATLLEPLSALGTPEAVGPLGTAAALKLVLNAAVLSSTVLLGEVLALAGQLGLETEPTLDALARTPVAPMVARIREQYSEVRGSLVLAAKDVALAAAPGPEALPMLDGARAQFAGAVAAGLGEQDFSAIVAAVRTNFEARREG